MGTEKERGVGVRAEKREGGGGEVPFPIKAI